MSSSNWRKDDSNCHQGTPGSTVRVLEPEMSPRAQHDSIKTVSLWLKQRKTQAERRPPAEQSGQASRRRFRECEKGLSVKPRHEDKAVDKGHVSEECKMAGSSLC